MPAHFFCQTGEFAGSSFRIGNEAMIGRNEDDVRLPAELVSGTHARIYFDEERGSYFLEDLGSRNGTKLDGMPVTDPVKLGPLHVVTFADCFDFVFHEGGGANATRQLAPREVEHTQPQAFAPTGVPPDEDDTGSTQTVRTDAYTPGALPADENASTEDDPGGTQTIRTEAFTPGAPPADADSGEQTRVVEAFTPSNLPGSGEAAGGDAAASAPVRFSLEVTRGDRGRVTFPLSEGENVVGRASTCAVSIDDRSVSRQHAMMTVRDGRVTLKDLGSRNHTFLDGDRVTSEVDVPLGGVIRFGLESEAKLRRA